MEEIYSKMFHAQYNQQGALLGTRIGHQQLPNVTIFKSPTSLCHRRQH